MKICGTEYWRRVRRITRQNLAKQAGVNPNTLRRVLDAQDAGQFTLTTLDKIAGALCVPIDSLLLSYDESELREEDRPCSFSRAENLYSNCIATYRHEKCLTMTQLGQRLGGASREWARKVCAAEMPRLKDVRRLADYEGLTVEDFLMLYNTDSEGGKT